MFFPQSLFPMMDIKIFTYGGGQGDGHGALSVQKNEKIAKIKFYIIKKKFLRWILHFSKGGGGVQGQG